MTIALTNSTDRPGEVVGRNTQVCGLISALMQTAHRLWPRKSALNLADRAGVSMRSVERWNQNKGGLSADALANIIRSEEGFEFLCAVMEKNQPGWWRLCSAVMAAAEVQRMQAAARRRLKRIINGALDADKSLSAALAKADSLLAHDEDFYREHSDALRATIGAAHRTMATSKPK